MNETAYQCAREYQLRAYVPYSSFHVGCAVVTAKGIYGGCNIENASYGATICAERVAVSKAWSENDRKILEIYVVGDSEMTYPCGICRQFLVETCPDATLYVFNKQGEHRSYPVKELLPYAFGKDDLDEH